MVESSGRRLGRTIGVDQAVNLEGPASEKRGVIPVQALLPLANGPRRVLSNIASTPPSSTASR